MDMDRVEVYATYEMWRRGVEFRLYERKANKHAAEIVWADYEEGTRTEPLLVFDGTQAQKLMDQLWDCGIRPTAGAGSAGAMAATERHLEDMRRLVFEKPTA